MDISCTATLHFQDGRTCVQPVSDFGIPVQLAKAKQLYRYQIHYKFTIAQ